MSVVPGAAVVVVVVGGGGGGVVPPDERAETTELRKPGFVYKRDISHSMTPAKLEYCLEKEMTDDI
jgi:hypothetical protein